MASLTPYLTQISQQAVLYIGTQISTGTIRNVNMRPLKPWSKKRNVAGFFAVVFDVTGPHQTVLYTGTQIVTGAITNVNMRPLEPWSKKRNVTGFIAVVLDVT